MSNRHFLKKAFHLRTPEVGAAVVWVENSNQRMTPMKSHRNQTHERSASLVSTSHR